MGDETVREAVSIGQELIDRTKQQLELMSRVLPADRMRAMRLVFLKMDEARLWLGEVGRG